VGSADTQFETTMGAFSGQELYVRRNEKLLQVSTLDSLDTPWLSSPKTINSLMASKSHEPSYHIVTKSGLGVIASPGHPVLVANKEGTPTQMKKASDLSIGEHLLTHEGSADEVVRVTQVDYKDELMNFNAASSKSAEHIVSMNGILLGDYAWQERLNSRDARVLLRADVARELMRER
jgi:intein/homing endonuclease